MSITQSLSISSSGLTAERFRLDVISSNIANANSMRANGKDPYRRRIVQVEGSPDGVRITGLLEDSRPFRQVLDRGNPNADPTTGMVTYSNIEPVEEMVNMMSASRAYEANLAAFNSAKSMMRSALSIGRAA